MSKCHWCYLNGRRTCGSFCGCTCHDEDLDEFDMVDEDDDEEEEEEEWESYEEEESGSDFSDCGSGE